MRTPHIVPTARARPARIRPVGPMRFGRSMVLLALGVGPAGCAGVARDVSRAAAPVAVSAGLEELATPGSQAHLKSVAASPAVQEAGYGVGLGIGRGFVDEEIAFMGGTGSHADEPPPAVGVAATTRAGTAVPAGAGPVGSVAPTTRAATGGRGMALLQSSLSPMVGQMVRSAVTEGMAQAMGPEGRAQVRAMAEAAGDGLVSGMSTAADRDAAPVLDRFIRDRLAPTLDEAARRRLGPALHDVLREQVEPVVRDLFAECARDTLKMPVRPENAPDVIANARNVSTGAGLGTHDALVNLGFLDQSGRWSLRLRIALWGGGILLALTCLAALTLLTLRVLLAWSDWRRARARPSAS